MPLNKRAGETTKPARAPTSAEITGIALPPAKTMAEQIGEKVEKGRTSGNRCAIARGTFGVEKLLEKMPENNLTMSWVFLPKGPLLSILIQPTPIAEMSVAQVRESTPKTGPNGPIPKEKELNSCGKTNTKP
jgi:hypothetical protein